MVFLPLVQQETEILSSFKFQDSPRLLRTVSSLSVSLMFSPRSHSSKAYITTVLFEVIFVVVYSVLFFKMDWLRFIRLMASNSLGRDMIPLST